MSDELDYDLTRAKVVKSNGRNLCRGENYGKNKTCPLPARNQKIPKGDQALRIKVYTSQGNHCNFYCKTCAKVILDEFRACIDELDKRV